MPITPRVPGKSSVLVAVRVQRQIINLIGLLVPPPPPQERTQLLVRLERRKSPALGSKTHQDFCSRFNAYTHAIDMVYPQIIATLARKRDEIESAKKA